MPERSVTPGKGRVRFAVARDWLHRPLYRMRVWRLKRRVEAIRRG
jgi:hypothetical protein